MSTDPEEPEYTPEQIRELKGRLSTAKTKTLSQLVKANAQLHKLLGVIASMHDTLREIENMARDTDEVAIEAAGAGHRLDPKARKKLVRVDGSAADFALSVIGLTEGGASTQDMQRVAEEMKAKFTTGSLHAAVHRLVGSGSIVKTNDKKGSAYRLTRTGANEWSDIIRRSNESK